MNHRCTRTLGVLFGLCFDGMALLGFAGIELRAQPTLQVIDIRPIFARHTNIGNSPGLAFDPHRNVFYLAHGSDSRGSFIYALDAQGNFLTEYDLQCAYQPGSIVVSLSYDVSARLIRRRFI